MLLFNDPKYSAVSISPDGDVIAYLAPNELGISNIFTKCSKCKYATLVTFENKRHISGYQWTGVPNMILYHQDNDGDENFRLFKVNITSPSPYNPVYTISDKPGIKALIIANNMRDPKILIGLNDENPMFHNVYEFDLLTNQMTRIFHNTRFPAKIMADNSLKIRMVMEEAHDGSLVYFRVSDKADFRNLDSMPGTWTEYLRVPPEDRILTIPLTFTADNRRIYWQWGASSDLGRLIIHEFGWPDNSEILYSAKRAQIGGIMFHPKDRTVMTITEIYHKPDIYVANTTVLEDMQYLVNLRPQGTPLIEDMSQDFNTWLVSYISDDQPFEYFLYKRVEKKMEYLFTTRPELVGRRMSKMVGFDFIARDGLRIQAYLSLPPHARLMSPHHLRGSKMALAKIGLMPMRPQKAIVSVHGGPKERDFLRFNSNNVWLTSRGYAVLQVNFRGSTGFGKNLTNAGSGEWGRKMHQDLLDAVEFLVRRGVVDRKQVAIMGGSYGGYATLVGMTFTPDVFACGVDIVGPSNLITLLETIPPYWKGFYNDLTRMLGADKKTRHGRKYLKSRSPLYFASRVKNPLMVIHGANDPRVKKSESDQFVAALKRNGIPVTYVVYPDEGHGMRKPQNMLAMSGFIEEFLHRCLGGDVEPFTLGQYNSTAIVPF
ncbi:prolyl oligopeptidase family domain-containing protein [Ditylenchus destructor]|uniref:Prolyl endopeptidase n=1 Tax=Ditylenchus destructor TaxID=166010 RepID=A0AAD4MNW0_9BILA|nr:prolyl oligopeptidase family domain-containing protein [Ditylenchus destructor]